MQKNILIGFLTLAVLLMSGCGKDATQQSTTGSLYGVITDKATGEPIKSAGVQLTQTGTKTVTGNEGQYEFTDIPTGDYTLKITKTGYSELISYNITVSGGKSNKGDVQIEKLPPSLRIVNNNTEDIGALDFGSAAADITRSFNIFNDGVESLEWEITKTSNWISKVSKENGTLKAGATQAIVVTIDRELLTTGDNTTTIQITSDNGSKQLSIKAANNNQLASVNVLEATNITSSTATFNAKITKVGSPSYTERGFVYSTTAMPTLSNSIAKITAAVTASTDYTAAVSGLTLNQKYYVRAYAINNAGTAYSTNEVSFTSSAVLPTVTTQDITSKNIGTGTVTFNGTIVNVGDPAYTERGFVYGLVHNPTVDDNTKKIASGSGLGVFSNNITGLTINNVYYVRAYATNTKGTAYGTEVVCDFSAVAPAVTTEAVTNIDATTATFNGTIVTVGDPVYTEKGFVYATTQNPTIDDAKKIVLGSGTGAFTANITGLTTQTIYYVRSYATNTKGTVYGAQLSFKPETPQYIVLSVVKLMVQKTDIGFVNWVTATSMCENSVLSGYSDWRLPTNNELMSLYTLRNTIGGFSTSSSSYYNSYWSSSLYSGNVYFYVISFYYGTLGNDYQSNSCWARCVRTLP